MNPIDLNTALLSSYDKDEYLLRLARLLLELRWNLLGSAGTVKFLREHSIAATDVATIVGNPILDHRVVTLSREIHAGLLADTEADFEELGRLGINALGLVYVTLYPLEKILADPFAPMGKVIEKTDVGGIALLHAAAKGQRVVISSPKQIDLVEPWLRQGQMDHNVLVGLVAAAERRAAEYLGISAAYWEAKIGDF